MSEMVVFSIEVSVAGYRAATAEVKKAVQPVKTRLNRSHLDAFRPLER